MFLSVLGSVPILSRITEDDIVSVRIFSYMEDFEIVDLMETLEDIGLETQEAFKVIGTKVPAERRSSYRISPVSSVKGSYDGQEWSTYGNDYAEFEKVEYKYPVDFKQQFQEHFSDKIKEMGKDYFFLDTSEPGIPSFTIWGNSSGIIKLKEEVKMKFPAAKILEIPNGKQ